MSTPRSSQDGFTLLEVMVAITLLLIAMAGFVPFFLEGLDQSSSTRYRSIATNLARERMEQVRVLDYREINSAGQLAALLGSTASVRGAQFTVSYAVETVAYDTGEMKKVTVTVDWNPPPASSPAVVSTMIHQQYMGPRISMVELDPTHNDPAGTPFDLLTDSNTRARVHVAQPDWGLIFADPTDPSQAPLAVYLRLVFVDDAGAVIPIGDSAQDFRLDSSYVDRSWGGGGELTDVFFDVEFDPTVIPDGYWDLRAIVYNQYDEPGNTWRLRIRREAWPPDAPDPFVAAPQPGNELVILTWGAGTERDRDHYVLKRRKMNADGTWPDWTTATLLSDTIAGNVYTYADAGSVAAMTDPWGLDDPLTVNYYEYQIWAIDWDNPPNEGLPAIVAAQVPPPPTTTLPGGTTLPPTTTTEVVSTTSTTVLYSVTISNNSGKSYSVTIRDSGSSQVFNGTVNKNSSIDVGGLAAGSYMIEARSPGRPDINQSFTLPAQAGQVVLTIL